MKKIFILALIISILFLGACASISAEKKVEEDSDNMNQTETVVNNEEKSLEEKEREEAKAKAEEEAKAAKEALEEQAFREEVISNIILEETSCEQQRNYIYSKGYVKNNSMYGLFGIQIRTEYLDSTGSIVDTDWTYAIAPHEFLLPDERKYFEIMTPANANIVNCNTYVLEFDM